MKRNGGHTVLAHTLGRRLAMKQGAFALALLALLLAGCSSGLSPSARVTATLAATRGLCQ
jgi:hypothetical protein